ncbi:MAG: hypothetical protein GY742_15275 [Hyphomicrobiales bacterium]|nr:hypothetical protein [Hyphomicrobiales bacterium]
MTLRLAALDAGRTGQVHVSAIASVQGVGLVCVAKGRRINMGEVPV